MFVLEIRRGKRMTKLKITFLNGSVTTIEGEVDIEKLSSLMGQRKVISGLDNRHYVNMKYAVTLDVIEE